VLGSDRAGTAVRPSRGSWPLLRLPERSLAASSDLAAGPPGLAAKRRHPRGRRARPHGVARTCRGSGAGSSVSAGFDAPGRAFSEAFRSSFAHRGLRTVALSLASLRASPVSRAFRRMPGGSSRLAPPFRATGGSAPETRAVKRTTPALPSWTSVLYSASSAADPVKDCPTELPPQSRPTRGVQPPPPSTLGVCEGARSRGHLPRPRRLTPRRASRAASRLPGTLLRFRLQGLAPPQGSVPLSRPLLSCALISPALPLSAAHEIRLQSLAPPEESVPQRAETPPRPMPS